MKDYIYLICVALFMCALFVFAMETMTTNCYQDIYENCVSNYSNVEYCGQ